MLRLECNVVPC